jgi:sulfur-oxidizing protein SoxA
MIIQFCQWPPEQRINLCRTQQQQAEALEYESEDLLSLTAFIAYQSRGLPLQVKVDGPAKPFFERGDQLYNRRIGQMNLACSHCHNQNWGKQLFSETISQGQPNAYPVYRLEWQTLGSLQRRLRSCNSGVRAELKPYGDADYIALELYLAWRGTGLPVETPGVRR